VSHRFRYAAFVLVVLSAAKVSAQAAPQPPDAQALRSAIDDLKKDFEARLSALETRLAAIEGGQQPPPGSHCHRSLRRFNRRRSGSVGAAALGNAAGGVRRGVQPGHGGDR
jgi:hypothetical protein